MNVVHAVTLVSDDSAFGGPTSVAYAQAAELARRGHQVTVLAGWDGSARFEPPGVQTSLTQVRHLLPTPGFSGLTAPGMLRTVWETRKDIDLLHIHLARDLITLPLASVARRLGIPFVTQTHGMVMPDQRLISRLTDSVFTRPALRRARAVMYLTATERQGLQNVSDRESLRLFDLPNGVPPSSLGDPPRSEPPVVIFCARLHPRKRVLAFAEMARLLVVRGSNADFVVAGPDEGDLPALRRFIESHSLADRLSYVGPLRPDMVRATLSQATAFVLPSENEPFPMTLLEALAEGVPAVLSDGCAIGDLVKGRGATVTDGSPESLADAVQKIVELSGSSPTLRLQARRTADESFSIASVVDRLESIYANSVHPAEL